MRVLKFRLILYGAIVGYEVHHKDVVGMCISYFKDVECKAGLEKRPRHNLKQQYIGRNTKEGIEIYENDIVDWENGQGIVFYNEEDASFRHSYQEKFDGVLENSHRPSKALWDVVEIIGNEQEITPDINVQHQAKKPDEMYILYKDKKIGICLKLHKRALLNQDIKEVREWLEANGMMVAISTN